MSFAQVIVFKKLGEFDEALTYRIPENLETSVAVGSFVGFPFRTGTGKGIVAAILSQLPTEVPLEKLRDLIGVIGSHRLSENQLKIAKFVADYYRTSLARALRLLVPKALWEGHFEEPHKTFIRLISANPPPLRGKKAQGIIEILRRAGGTLPTEGLKEQSGGFTAETLRRLMEMGVVETVTEALFAPFDPQSVVQKEPEKQLTQKQAEALESIRSADKPMLLHGVTGSGKTELYLRLILETIRQGKQAILLVPEIALTPQTIGYFRETLGDSIAVFHSKLSEGERLKMWWKVQSGSAALAIGSRSAIFAPAKNLGLIILDEEHEWTYKQESAPYYRTHRIAEEMAKLWGAKLVFGSATPSAESFQKTITGEYGIAYLADRIQETEMPLIHLVDLREEFKKRNFSVFSLLLQNKIRERLAKKEQVILFVNQRGLANAVVCRDCGYTEKCPRCDIALKYHKSYQRSAISDQRKTFVADGRSLMADRLVCHYCQFEKSPELLCPECRSPYIKHVGVGTQRVEEEARKLFPKARVIRADKDTTDGKTGFEPIYHDFLEGKFDILVGTQMVAKGLDFGNVSLIGIVLADVGLHQPDFRSSERLYQILTQVSGRCGRRGERGEVVLQTYNPTHPTIRMAAEQCYPEFIEAELRHRQAFGYPPYSRMIKFTVVGSDLGKLSRHIETERQTLEDISKSNALPITVASAPASISKMADRYYYHVLIRSDKPEILLDHWKIPKGWRIDVDPVHTT
jgi:primosomal protein N' (replication factor Y) (superfamily II helicase)